MVNIKNKFYSARLHALYEKVDENNALLAVNKDIVTESCDRRVNSLKKKQNSP